MCAGIRFVFGRPIKAIVWATLLGTQTAPLVTWGSLGTNSVKKLSTFFSYVWPVKSQTVTDRSW